MRGESDEIAVWLVAFHGDLDEGVAALGELGIGPEDARRTLAMVPLVLAEKLSTGSARQVAARLEAVGATVELRRAATAPRPPRRPRVSPALGLSPTTSPSIWKPVLTVAFGLVLLYGLFEGLRLAAVVGGGGAGGAMASTLGGGGFRALFASREDRLITEGFAEEMERHCHVPEAYRLLQRLANGDDDEEALRAHFRGLTYFSHADLVAYFGIVHRVVSSPNACEDELSEDVVHRALSPESLVSLGRLTARAIAAGAIDRPRTSGHERAMDEGMLVIQRRLAAHERPDFDALVERVRANDEESECEFMGVMLAGANEMHPDLQRRFLRAFAHFVAEHADAF